MLTLPLTFLAASYAYEFNTFTSFGLVQEAETGRLLTRQQMFNRSASFLFTECADRWGSRAGTHES